MNRLLWLLLNLVLVAAFCGMGLLLAENDPRARWDQLRKDALDAEQDPVAKPARDEEAEETSPAVRDRMDSKALETLWRRSLFRPDRTEDVAKADDDGESEEKPPQDEWTFELKATARLNERRIAIIQIDQAKRAPVRRGRVTRPTHTRKRPAISPKAKPDEAKKKPKRLFREGETLAETGYVLVEIRMDEVVIRKGDDERILTIERDDAGSIERREAAAAESKPAPKAPDEGGKAKPATAKRPVHTPPPPPGGPGGPGAPPGASSPGGNTRATVNSAMEKRRQRIAEERKRLLEKQRTSRTTN